LDAGLRKVKRRRQMKQRQCMIEGTAKMELGAKEGRGYSRGNQMRDESKDGESEERKIKKKKARTRMAISTGMCQRTNASVEGLITSKSHHQDAHGRGFLRWKLPKIMRRGCAKLLFLKIVKRTWLFLLQDLRRMLRRKGTRNLEIAKTTYSQLVSILARHLKIPSETPLKYMQLTWYTFCSRRKRTEF
jgi:hypothetical protein